MSTLIKRLYLQGTEFVPITLSEAVVVNTTGITGLSSLKITTLDKVLKTIMTVVGTNTLDIDALEKQLELYVLEINSELEGKLDKLTPGQGITISPEGVISCTSSVELYKIVLVLPEASEDCLNVIYLVPSGSVGGNLFKEYICVYETKLGRYIWEAIGEILTEVDLSDYVTKEEFNSQIGIINSQLSNTITAQDVTTSSGILVVVNYNIPANLYDSMVTTDSSDLIIGG